MPKITSIDDRIEPDLIPGSVLAFGITDVDRSFELEAHSHAKAELMLTTRGALTCETEDGLWIAPPQCAIWLPANVTHSIKGTASIEGFALLVDSSMSIMLPHECCTVSVTPLLRELVIRCATLPSLSTETGIGRNLINLLLDELSLAPREKLCLPMPSDPRLREMAEELILDPANRLTLGQWGKRLGMSERTLHRLLGRETGLSFTSWRQQMHVLVSLQRLSKGATVQQVAIDTGYDSAGSFITMFKKNMGSPPARYISTRRHCPAESQDEPTP